MRSTRVRGFACYQRERHMTPASRQQLGLWPGTARSAIAAGVVFAIALFAVPARAAAAPDALADAATLQIAEPQARPVERRGETFFDKLLEVTTPDGQVGLRGAPNGSEPLWIDDVLTISVTHDDGTTADVEYDFSRECQGFIERRDQFDLSDVLRPGRNVVRIIFRDTCGSAVGNSPVWLVGNGKFKLLAVNPYGDPVGNSNPFPFVGFVERNPEVKGPVPDSWTTTCTATLVLANYAITAQHCTRHNWWKRLVFDNRLRVTFGRLARSDTSAGHTRRVVKVIRKEGYKGKKDGYNNDVALLKLDHPVPIEPVFLASPDDRSAWVPGAEVIALGWGEQDPDNAASGSDVLRVVHQRLDVAERYGGDPERQLVGAPKPERPQWATKGYSGGPLLAGTGDGRYVQVGVISAHFPAVEEGARFPEGHLNSYARVGAGPLQRWILDRIGSHLDNGEFERPDIKRDAQRVGPDDLMGRWRVRAGSVLLHRRGDWRPAEGDQSIELGNCAAGHIVQRVLIEPGQQYTLRFHYAGNPVERGIKRFRVEINGRSIASLAFDSSASSRSRMGWQLEVLSFSLANVSVDLAFVGDGATPDGCGGATLDAVQLLKGVFF
jgi:V8-like Glu-specific endopeptidase